jgi:N-acetylglucosaminyldiphosphoundecaprenol N-acetyl-beta-D-mannosaminyltransferase
MELYFNVEIEFNADKVDEVIQTTIREGGKGYVCSVESNNLTIANLNPCFREVINGALINICDGSNLAWILGKIYHKPFKSYIGADLFAQYVSMAKYRQYFLGNTSEVLSGLQANLSKTDSKISGMCFEELPFLPVADFDYKGIAAKINQDNPDIIWVSLGAPKQEEFMSRLLPYIDRGVMFGFGAIFNFNAGVGSVKRAPLWMQRLHLEWLYRAFEEPKKNVPRYARFIKLLPRLLINEYKMKKTRGNEA